VLYAAFLHIVLIYPSVYILKNRKTPEEKPVVISEKQVVSKLLELCYKQGISPEELLNAEEINFGK
jgi:hypothetical protein